MKSILFLYLIIVGSFDYDSLPLFRPQHTTESIIYSNKSGQPIPILISSRTTHMLRWSYFSSNTNALNHSLTGNRRRLGYKLAFWNCRKGLIGNSEQDTPKLVDIKKFIEKHRPHVFGIIEANLHSTESRLQRKTTVSLKQIEEKLKIDGYKIELPDTWSSFGQARIIVYVHEELNYKRKPMEQTYSDLPNVTLEIGLGRERKSIVNVFYREWTGGVNGESSQDSQVRRWARQISYWKSLNSQNRDFVALGDANLCATKWNEADYDASRKQLSDMVQEHLLEESSHQIVEGYTRSELVRNSVTRSTIDHVYTNCATKCEKPKIEAAGDSDHLAVLFTKYTKELIYRPHTVLKRSYKFFDTALFLQDIFKSNLDDKITGAKDIETAAKMFQDIFGEILDKHAPVKIFQTRKNYLPYLSEDTKRLMEERDALKEEATKTGDEILMKEYKLRRNWIKNSLAKEEANYYEEKLSEEKITTKKAWKIVYDMLGQVSSKSPSKIKFEDKIISNPKALANAFNRIFKEKVSKLRTTTVNAPKIDPVDRLKAWLKDKALPRFELKKIDLNKLRSIMKKLKPSRSHGTDFIDSNSIKLAFPLIEKAILHLVNLSISSKQFAQLWKTQLVLPLHKKNDTMDGNNYRPVSHIIELGKIIEYVVHEQVYSHFKSHQLFHGNHHGFLGNRSTATALIQLFDILLTAAENSELSAALLLDLSAAFDIVDHKIFLQKLTTYNFSEDSVEWFDSYLSGRYQTVQVESKFSAPEPLAEHGVPQGSILGPLIFIIFNNDFAASAEEGESILYADDDTEVVHDKDPEKLKEKIQREADRSTDWVADNRMVCAGNKTKLMIIGTAQLRNSRFKNQNMKINVCGSDIEDTKSEKLLGLVIDNKLSWKETLYGEKWRSDGNAKGLIPQLSQRAGLLSKIVHLMPPHRFKLFCNGIFYSKLLYCLQVFGNVWGIANYDVSIRRFSSFTKDDNRKLQILQNKVLRLKTGLPRETPTTVLLQASNDLSVQQLTAYTSLLTAQKSIFHQEPAYLAEHLTLRSNSINQAHTRLTVTRGGFFYRTAAIFNSLPDDLRCPMEPKVFKAKIKPWVKKNIPIKPG